MTNRRRNEPQREVTALEDEGTERLVIGACLADPDLTWDYHGILDPEHFATPRLSRIWRAMMKACDKSKRPTRDQVRLFIRDDSQETTALPMFLAVLSDAITQSDDRVDLGAMVEIILHLKAKRNLIAAHTEAIERVKRMDMGSSVEDMIDESISAVSSAASGGATDKWIRSYAQVADDLVREIEADTKAGDEGQSRGLATGLRGVQEVIGPALPGKVYVLGGLSSIGKTALASSIMEAMAEDAKHKGLGPGYTASMEMSGREHASRLLANQLGLSSYKLERSEVNRAELQMLAERAVDIAKRFPIMIDTKPRLTMEDIRARMMKQKHQRGISFGLLDHILLIRSPNKRDGLMDRVMDAVIEAKLLANELGIPIFLISQVNEKNVIDRKSGEPIASDLFGGQAIQQNADVTFFIHRPEVVTKRKGAEGSSQEAISAWEMKLEREKGKAVIWNDKGRGHGSGIRRELTFDGPSISFRDI